MAREPTQLVSEEPGQFWAKVPTLDPVSYLLTPWAGYLQVFARTAFLVAYPFGTLGPLLTRLLAAAVIAAVAAFIASDRLADAIPERSVRIGLGLSLALFPPANPYFGPLNAQSWMCIAALGLALSKPRRFDYPILLAMGFSGLLPLLTIPAWRDRRLVALLIPAAVQAALVLTSDRRPIPQELRATFVLTALVLVAVMAIARLPLRTRLAFTYLGVVTIALGSVAIAPTDGGLRYLTPACAGIALGGLSLAAAWLRWPQQSRRRPAQE